MMTEFYVFLGELFIGPMVYATVVVKGPLVKSYTTHKFKERSVNL